MVHIYLYICLYVYSMYTIYVVQIYMYMYALHIIYIYLHTHTNAFMCLWVCRIRCITDSDWCADPTPPCCECSPAPSWCLFLLCPDHMSGQYHGMHSLFSFSCPSIPWFLQEGATLSSSTAHCMEAGGLATCVKMELGVKCRQ